MVLIRLKLPSGCRTDVFSNLSASSSADQLVQLFNAVNFDWYKNLLKIMDPSWVVFVDSSRRADELLLQPSRHT
jgi:hypothetical protein